MFFNPVVGLGVHCNDISPPIARERYMSGRIIQVYSQQTVLLHLKRFKAQDGDLVLGSNADRTRRLGMRKHEFISRPQGATPDLVGKNLFQVTHTVEFSHKSRETALSVSGNPGDSQWPRSRLVLFRTRRGGAFQSG